jgi:PAS domain S-box-containing protein
MGLWHRDGRIINANTAFLEMVGYSREEMERDQLRWDVLTPPEYCHLDQKAIDDLDARRPTTPYEKEYVLRDGRRVPVMITSTLLGEATEYGLVMAIDVTQHRLIERAMRENEQQYHNVFDAANDGFIICDLQGFVVEANASACQAYGYSHDQFIGLSSSELTHLDYKAELERFLSALHKGESFQAQVVNIRKDGSHFPVEVSGTSFVYKGQPHFLYVVRDISKRKRFEDELRYQLSLTETIANNAAESLFLLDSEGFITYMNPAAEQTFGWSLEEMTGRRLHNILHYKRPGGEPYPAEECPLLMVLQQSQTLRDHEDWFVHRDGTFIPISCSNAPIFQDERVTGAVLVVHNNTERQRAENDRRAAEEERIQIQERLRLATDAADLGTWDANILEGTLAWSDRCKTIFGFEQDEPVSTSLFLERVHPQDRERMNEVISKAFDPGGDGSYENEYRIVWPNETVHWVSTKGRVFFEQENGERRATRFVGIAAEVTARKRAAQQEHLLSSASVELASSLDYETTLNHVVRLAVPGLADWCVADLLDDDGSLRQLAVAHVNPAKEELLRELRRLNPHDPQRTVGVAQVLRTGEPELCHSFTPAVAHIYIHDERSAQISQDLGVVSYMLVPMRARGRNIGALAFGSRNHATITMKKTSSSPANSRSAPLSRWTMHACSATRKTHDSKPKTPTAPKTSFWPHFPTNCARR